MEPGELKLTDFLNAYETYVQSILKPTQLEFKELMDSWSAPDFWGKYKKTNRIPIPTPVQTWFSRVKRPEQVVDKILRKPKTFPQGLHTSSFKHMHDAFGVRIIVYFLSHLPLIDREFRSSPALEISAREKPTAYMSAQNARVLGLDHLYQEEKESGYSSIHYILRLKNSSINKGQSPWFEVQVKTLTQELWSVMEHHMGYKPSKRTSITARRQFKILAKTLGAVDEHFNLLYEELNRYQAEADYKGTDPLTPENLPPVLSEHGIGCTQRDINNIIKFLYSRGVHTIDKLRDLATARRLETIRNTYLSTLGRPPNSLEVIASLAALRGVDDQNAELAQIRAQIDFRGAWDGIRQEFTQT